MGAITLGDLGAAPSGEPQILKRLRDTHHGLARNLAAGMDYVEASRVSGYSPTRIAALVRDPSFQELVSHYKGIVKVAFLDTHTKLAALASDAVQELSARLEEDPESFSHNQLLDVVKVSADRSGNGPTSTVNQRTLILDASKIDEIKQRAKPQNIRRLTDLDGSFTIGAERAVLTGPAQEPASAEAPEGLPSGGPEV
jgi:hypothetical protein